MKLALVVPTPDVNIPIPVALLRGTFTERLQKAAQLGYNGVELMPARPAELNASDIRVQVEAHGLEIAAIGSGSIYLVDKLTLMATDSLIRDQARKRFEALIEFAAAVEAPLVTIGGFRGRLASVNEPESRAMFQNILSDLADTAAAYGIRIVMEPLNRYETDCLYTVEETLALIETLGYANLGVLPDTYHLNIEESSLTDCFRRAMAANRLWHIHLGDNNRLPPGQGHIDFAAIVSTLADIGYKDYLSAELLPRPDPDTAGRQTIDFMRKYVDQ